MDASRLRQIVENEYVRLQYIAAESPSRLLGRCKRFVGRMRGCGARLIREFTENVD